MIFFQKRKKTAAIPEGFSASDIKIETSICTGEKIIGFYDSSLKKLCYAELVRNEDDISSFYMKYGIRESDIK